METRELICIGCPLGCPLTVRLDGEQMEISGNTCKRGEDYARKEVQTPPESSRPRSASPAGMWRWCP